MSFSKRRALCGILIAGGVLAGPAAATTPDSGAVSKAAPKFEWTGETTAGYITRMPTAVSGSEETPCEAPSCDSFTLSVADSANLVIAESLDTDSADAAATIRIIQPDGSVVQTDTDPGGASNKFFKITIKNAKTGDYTIHHYDNAADGQTFHAYAELAVPAAAAPTAPLPATPSAPAAVEAVTLGVKAPAASAKKLAKTRKYTASITVSRAVTAVTAVLKKGSKTYGSGKLASASGTAKLALKVAKKLKPGTYALTVSVNDGTTATTKTVKVKVKK